MGDIEATIGGFVTALGGFAIVLVVLVVGYFVVARMGRMRGY